MSIWLLWVTTAIYGFVSIELLAKGNTGMSVAFLGYTVANCGIIWSLK